MTASRAASDGSAARCANASTVAAEAISAFVLFLIDVVPTDAPMPAPPMPMPRLPATKLALVSSLTPTSTLPLAVTWALEPIVACVVRSSTVTETAPPTATVPEPAMPAATEMTLSRACAVTRTSLSALTTARAPIQASVPIVTTRTSAPGAAETAPEIASAPATPSWRKSLAAATMTDWPVTAPVLSAFTVASSPM